MDIIVVGDTHGKHNHLDLPSGDLLIHTGDFTKRGNFVETRYFLNWISQINGFDYKVIVPGNHDIIFEEEPEKAQKMIPENVDLLINESITINGYQIYGTPYQPSFCNWAFNIDNEKELAKIYKGIEDGTDILISHTPPLNKLDKAKRGERVGSEALRDKVKDVQPMLNLFGHIHEEYGYSWDGSTVYVNASLSYYGGYVEIKTEDKSISNIALKN